MDKLLDHRRLVLNILCRLRPLIANLHRPRQGRRRHFLAVPKSRASLGFWVFGAQQSGPKKMAFPLGGEKEEKPDRIGTLVHLQSCKRTASTAALVAFGVWVACFSVHVFAVGSLAVQGCRLWVVECGTGSASLSRCSHDCYDGLFGCPPPPIQTLNCLACVVVPLAIPAFGGPWSRPSWRHNVHAV